MLSLLGKPLRFCDGLSRRSFLQIGALSFGSLSLSLADIFRAEARAGVGTRRHKSVINIFLGGGPPHQDMWDIKTEASPEIRGEFKPIATRVTGIQIGETFPRIAGLMDRVAIIRSVVGAFGGHDAFQCVTGWDPKELKAMGGHPSLGSVVAKLQGPVDVSVPPFVGLADRTGEIRWSDPGKPGFLGPSYGAFKPDGPGLANMQLKGTTLETLADRKRLLGSFDTLRREIDASGALEGMEASAQRAFDVLTSSKLLEALDLSREPDRVRERYGDGKPFNYQYDGAPTVNEHLLMARRLVEAGVRVVSLSYGRWDSHSKNFDLVRDHGSKLDQCLSALIEDLHLRGLQDDVTVIAWGEFGRTPRINKNAGRDHWPQVSCALLAGGGMKTGQVIGATNKNGEYAAQRPVHFQEIFATLYHNLGIDPSGTTVKDPSGRPQHLIEREPVKELLG
jgi:hypothetical protein